MHHKKFALIAALSFFAACSSDAPTYAVDDGVRGTVSFNDAGGLDASYSADGAISTSAFENSPFITTWATYNWAAGYKWPYDYTTNINANIARTSTTSDVLNIIIRGQTTGTQTIVPQCSGPNGGCSEVELQVGFDPASSGWSRECMLLDGSITIASLTSTHVTGSFSGTGTCILSGTETRTTWVVTNGTFDVPLVTKDTPGVPAVSAH